MKKKNVYEIYLNNDRSNPIAEYNNLDDVYEQIKIYKEYDKKENEKNTYTIYENGVLHTANV